MRSLCKATLSGSMVLLVASTLRAQNPARDAPPAVVQARMARGLDYIFSGKYAARFKADYKTEVFTLAGVRRRVSTEQWQVSGDGKQQLAWELLAATDNGKDVSAKKRTAVKPPKRGGTGGGQEAAPTAGQKEGNREKGQLEKQLTALVYPFGADASLYVFGPLGQKDDLCSQSFTPAAKAPARKTRQMLKGTMNWNCTSLAPQSMEVELFKNPRFIKQAAGRLVFEPVGADYIPSRITLTGIGGFLFIKRRFKHAMSFDDFGASPAQ